MAGKVRSAARLELKYLPPARNPPAWLAQVRMLADPRATFSKLIGLDMDLTAALGRWAAPPAPVGAARASAAHTHACSA